MPGPSRRSTEIQTGQFAKIGIQIEASAFGGDAKMQQALTADGIDIGIGGGPSMAFMAKGVPTNMALMVNSSGRSGQSGARHRREHAARVLAILPEELALDGQGQIDWPSLSLLKDIPDNNFMFTTQFVPVKAGL